eukprot:g2281.t1
MSDSEEYIYDDDDDEEDDGDDYDYDDHALDDNGGGEGDAEGCENARSTGSDGKTCLRQVSYDAFDEQNIPAQQALIRIELQKIIPSLNFAELHILLNYYRWSLESCTTAWFADEAETRRKCGLQQKGQAQLEDNLRGCTLCGAKPRPADGNIAKPRRQKKRTMKGLKAVTKQLRALIKGGVYEACIPSEEDSFKIEVKVEAKGYWRGITAVFHRAKAEGKLKGEAANYANAHDEAAKQKEEQERLAWHRERFDFMANSVSFMEENVNPKMKHAAETFALVIKSKELKNTILSAYDILVRCRKLLALCYIAKYYIKNDNAAGVALFQKNHTDLEAFAEQLSQYLTRTDWISQLDDIVLLHDKLREVHQHATMTEYFLRKMHDADEFEDIFNPNLD